MHTSHSYIAATAPTIESRPRPFQASADRPAHSRSLGGQEGERRAARPPADPAQAVARRIQRQHDRGNSFRKIAADLNEAQVPTAQDGREWYPATVRQVLLRTS
jgi:hypothetical protein